jgi:uncharacterized protein (DUF58 family)
VFAAPLRMFVLGVDVVFALAIALDFVLTPRPDRLGVRRRLPASAGLSQEFARSLRVDVGAVSRAAGLELEVHEEFADAFEVRARSVRSPRAIANDSKGARDERAGAALDAASTASSRSSGSSAPNASTGSSASSVRSGDGTSDALRIASRVAPAGLSAPAAGDPSGGPDVTLLPASGPIDLVRIYRSSRRGVHALGDMRLRLRGRFGLVQRQSRMRGAQSIEIEPALLNLKHTLTLAASERWRDLGLRHLRRRGGMTEFESLRDHVHGDDLRLVDWKAFAKRGRPIVRQFQEERGQEMLIVIDCGRRMSTTSEEVVAPNDPEARATSASISERRDGATSTVRAASRRARATIPVAGWTKLDHALDAALQIAAVALQRGDRVGAMAFDSRVRAFVAPARGSRQLERLRDALFALQASPLESDLERALSELSVRHRRRALVLILTDVADPLSIDRQRAALATGSRRHKILFATLDDPSLRAAAEGTLRVDASVRAAAMELQEERRTSLRRLSRTGARVLDTLPAEAAAPLLAAWLEMRRGG